MSLCQLHMYTDFSHSRAICWPATKRRLSENANHSCRIFVVKPKQKWQTNRLFFSYSKEGNDYWLHVEATKNCRENRRWRKKKRRKTAHNRMNKKRKHSRNCGFVCSCLDPKKERKRTRIARKRKMLATNKLAHWCVRCPAINSRWAPFFFVFHYSTFVSNHRCFFPLLLLFIFLFHWFVLQKHDSLFQSHWPQKPNRFSSESENSVHITFKRIVWSLWL